MMHHANRMVPSCFPTWPNGTDSTLTHWPFHGYPGLEPLVHNSRSPRSLYSSLNSPWIIYPLHTRSCIQYLCPCSRWSWFVNPLIKGTVSWDFRFPYFSSKGSTWAPSPANISRVPIRIGTCYLKFDTPLIARWSLQERDSTPCCLLLFHHEGSWFATHKGSGEMYSPL